MTALLQEADSYPAFSMDTVFIGGGTPSLLPPEWLSQLLDGLHRHFAITPGAEWTSEANPGTLTASWLDAAVAGGVNRLSLGMQAYQPRLLHTLGRIHDYEQVVSSVSLARHAGFQNINLDLMFGLPGQTTSDWLETLEAALALQPQHLSCYGLIPEEGTPLMAALQEGSLTLPDEDSERQMYDDALRILAQHGFQQYEISNFALPGFSCKHNIGYWRQTPYLGLGASAASCLPADNDCVYIRHTNPFSLHDYQSMIAAQGWSMRETIPITASEARFETLMLGLRMTEGVSASDFLAMHGVELDACYGSRLQALREQGLLIDSQGRWRLTRRGMDVQNAILVALMEE